jgi:EipB-like
MLMANRQIPQIAGALASLLLVAGISLRHAIAIPPAPELASHRAVYELKLAHARGNSTAVSARGRILYDFSGNTCDGYVLQFRQVSELDNGEGKITLSDLRSTTWEDAAATRFIFKSQNYLNETLIDTVDGQAERLADKVAVSLTNPIAKKFDLQQAVAFPTDHMRRIIEAAREERSLLEAAVYDASDKGDKLYNTLTVIGHPIVSDDRVPADAAAGQQALAGLKRWPVTVSYFDSAATTADQPPIYAIRFELYENGVSRALVLDYNDFAISGELSSIEVREAKPCTR